MQCRSFWRCTLAWLISIRLSQSHMQRLMGELYRRLIDSNDRFGRTSCWFEIAFYVHCLIGGEKHWQHHRSSQSSGKLHQIEALLWFISIGGPWPCNIHCGFSFPIFLSKLGKVFGISHLAVLWRSVSVKYELLDFAINCHLLHNNFKNEKKVHKINISCLPKLRDNGTFKQIS